MTGCSPISRRKALGGLAFGLGSYLGSAPSYGSAPDDSVLVFLALRGGLDGLSAVIPIDEPRYYDLRPHISVASPRAIGSKREFRALPLESGFALHPALAELQPIFRAKNLAFIHGAGTVGVSRSHFEAQDAMDMGFVGRPPSNGWLGRLTKLQGSNGSLVQSVSIGTKAAPGLLGSPSVLAINDLETFELGQVQSAALLQAALEDNYRAARGVAGKAGNRALDAARLLRQIRKGVPGHHADYPRLYRPLSELARLIRADVGVRVATFDVGGWDTHARQGAAAGPLARGLTQLARGLAAFERDLGDLATRVTLVAATEFGRTVAQNGSGGTDHGRGSVAFVMGGGVRGGQIFGDFRGLSEVDLEDGRDLAVTTDLRAIFREASEHVLRRSLSATEKGFLFPDFVSDKRLSLFEPV